jgi:hypothetical protein
MAFIKNESPKIGDWVFTRKSHSAMSGTMTAGSRVKITDVDPMRGYSIVDEEGNRLCEIGWII